MNKIRLYENFHVVLWLLKDTCWLMHFKLAGAIMTVPTFIMAVYITWVTRNRPGMFIPNLAVCCWISANITWMLGEFYEYPFKVPALCFFASGLLVIGYYFLRQMRAKAL